MGPRSRRLGPALAAASGSLALGLALFVPGCGARFDLPTETPGKLIPGDGTYQMVATWTGMTGVQDILLTQGAGTQLFVLFNIGGADLSPRGRVASYARLIATKDNPAPIAGIGFQSLFNPVALASGASRIFVLDAGDSCLAKTDPASPNVCNPDYLAAGRRVTNLHATWRAREYGLLGGDTMSTFTDTTFAEPKGIAVDAQGDVYISGVAMVSVPDPNDDRIRTRQFQFRIYRYKRGPRYPGIVPADRLMPGADWHRDTTYVVEQGSGIGTLQDPRGIFWSAASGNALYAADFGKNVVQKLSDVESSTGFFAIDGGFSGSALDGPLDVSVDLAGFIYICDTGNRRLLRYGLGSDFVQVVNIEKDSQGDTLQNPVAIAADDSLVYVAELDLGRVVRYQRRK
jgi:hypothetical protein